MANSGRALVKFTLAISALIGSMLACERIAPKDAPGMILSADNLKGGEDISGPEVPVPFMLPTRLPGAPILTPTPDAPHPLPALRTDPDQYVVQPGDTLNLIARGYNVSIDDIIVANSLTNPDYLEIGQILVIPPPKPGPPGPDFKIIPDSELVFGPVGSTFDIGAFIVDQGGYLADYEEEVDGETLNGAEIVLRVAQDFSVNPRLLLTALEYQSNWITRVKPNKESLDYPLGALISWRKGLYHQLAWTADNLNRGYYLWRVNGLAAWVLPDGNIVPIAPTINAGSAGVQHFFAQLLDRPKWEQAVAERGLFETYTALFGYPFDYAIEPLVPPGLTQPTMQLPFEEGVSWAFTGGPHGGWGDGSAWAALDFAPPGEALGCVTSDAWVVAIADGPVIRAANGAVVQDIDDPETLPSDGLEQTGWTVLYMHIESRQRVSAGTYLRAGERIGHPSCEGGVSSGTHVHVARRYNGEWIPADQSLPFVMDGWVSVGFGSVYDGAMQKNNKSIEAWEGRSPENEIRR